MFNVVASGDFLRADGSAAFPEFDMRRLQEHPRIRFRYLEPTPVVTPGQVEDADALVLSGPRVCGDSFHTNGRLTLIAQFGAGFDHIDVEAATRNGVAVANTPSGVRRPVAVAILTLMLALTSKLLIKSRLVRQGPEGWAAVTRYNGVGLSGKVLGSVGLGNIGAEMFRLAKPLDMTFIAHDPRPSPTLAAELGVELVDLDSLFRRADIVCINCPLTPQARHLVDAERLSLMKSTAFLINTARGGIVDQRALTACLATGRIAGAGLDVFEEEPPDPSDPLFALDNVVMTPHALCWTDELYAGCGRAAVGAVLDVLHGRAPAHIVNGDVVLQEAWCRKLARFAAAASAR
jgi:phosphoglycerate dehydrogenase-like enzyme